MTKLSNSNSYCKCKSPKVKLPKIIRVQKVDKTAILQVQKSKGQTTQNIKSAKGRKPNIALDLCHFCNDLQYLISDLLHS